MLVPVTWLREITGLPDSVSTGQLADRLTAYDLKLEEIRGGGVSGPLVVGLVLTADKEPQKNGKTINWCTVDTGDAEPRGIVCGAHNFGPGDLVVVSLPGTHLPALGFTITARKTYGHVSDGMICSTAELGLLGDADGIIVLPAGSARPGDDAVALLGLGEQTLDLEVNPDRGYAWSMRGVARDTALAFGLDFTDPAERPVPAAGASYPVEVEDPAACGRFVVREVRGFDPSRPTPDTIVRRLDQCGMRSISLAVDISNYVMLELGQPNHAYDVSKLHGAIRVRRAIEGEKLTTLDDVVRTLDPADLVIADDHGPIGLAGVMGGDRVEIDAGSTDIVIEAAHFDPVTIFRSSRRHRLSSEASKRFERGVDPALPERAAQRVAELLVEHGGGEIQLGLTVVGDVTVRPTVRIDPALASRVAGIGISTEAVVDVLEANGCDVATDADRLAVTPPSWRFDLVDPNDFAEEVLRSVGYDQIPSVLPAAPAGRGLTRAQVLQRRVGLVLAGAGLTEIKTFPFAGPDDFDMLRLPPGDPRRDQVLLENPLASQAPGLTTTLFTGLLSAAALNVGRGHDDVSITEIGRVFLSRPDAPAAPIYGVDARPTPEQFAALDTALPDQPLHAGVVMVGQRERAGWPGPGRAVTWADAIAVVRLLADNLHVELRVQAASLAPFHPGRCAVFILGEHIVGYAGEFHPGVLEAYRLPARGVGAEVNLSTLIDASPKVSPRPDFSTFPVAKEDLAFIVDNEVAAGAMADSLAGAHELVESVRLFDVYAGEQLGAGKKSLAFAVRLRGAGRTLTEADISAARSALVAAATDRFGAELRR